MAALSKDAEALRNLAIADLEQFYLILGPLPKDTYQGAAAIEKIAGAGMGCYQASPMQDLSQVGAVLTLSGTKHTAIFRFDGDSKLQRITVMAAAKAADALGVNEQAWLDPDTLACAKKKNSMAPA